VKPLYYHTQPDQKNGHKPKSTPVAEPTGLRTGSAELMLGQMSDTAIGILASRVSDQPWQTAQRQALAVLLGQVQGNHHLQRWAVAQRQTAGPMAPTDTAPPSLGPATPARPMSSPEADNAIPPQTQPTGKSIPAITSDLANPKIAELAQALDELAHLAQFAPATGGQHGLKWEKLSGEALDSNPRYQEKHIPERDAIVGAVGRVRALIQGLTPAELGVDAATAQQVQAHYFGQLNTLTPYYTQMANRDVLYTETAVKDKKGNVTVKKLKEAWERTCNVTSMAMTLEGLGTKIQDFKGNAALMEQIAGQYGIQNVTGLRLPDFLQLVAIYVSFREKFPDADLATLQPDDFAGKVSAARAAAADLVLLSGRFDEFTTLFGVQATLVTNPLEEALTRTGELHQTNKGIVKAEAAVTALQGEIKRLEDSLASAKDKQKPGIQKKIDAKRDALKQMQQGLERRRAGKQKQIEQYVDSDIKETERAIKKLEGKYTSLEKSLTKAKASKKPEIEKKMASLQELLKTERASLEAQRQERDDHIANFEGELEASLPVQTYRDSVLNPLRAALASGKQVIANRVSHFVRLESVSEQEIIIDDPAESGKNFKMTWEEARVQGFFRRYVILEK